MKKTTLILIACGTLLIGCGADAKKDDKPDTTDEAATDVKNEDTAEPAIELNESADLSEFDMPVKMKAPAGYVITDEYGLRLTRGETFSMEISEDNYQTVEERKEQLEENDLNVHKNYVVDEENGFISENEVMGQTEYHIFYLIQHGDHTYSFENTKGRSFSLAEAEAMYNAAKSAKIKE